MLKLCWIRFRLWDATDERWKCPTILLHIAMISCTALCESRPSLIANCREWAKHPKCAREASRIALAILLALSVTTKCALSSVIFHFSSKFSTWAAGGAAYKGWLLSNFEANCIRFPQDMSEQTIFFIFCSLCKMKKIYSSKKHNSIWLKFCTLLGHLKAIISTKFDCTKINLLAGLHSKLLAWATKNQAIGN